MVLRPWGALTGRQRERPAEALLHPAPRRPVRAAREGARGRVSQKGGIRPDRHRQARAVSEEGRGEEEAEAEGGGGPGVWGGPSVTRLLADQTKTHTPPLSS